MPRGKRSTPEAVALTLKDREALELRKSGATFAAIAQELGYADGGGAYKAVSRALLATLQEPADELRRLELERLDALLAGVWTDATAGDPKALDACLRIMDRRARLLGLDAPQRRIVDFITTDAWARAMQEVEAEIAELEAAGHRDRSEPD